MWLPDAFTPLSVTGVKHVSYDPVSDSLITPKSTSDGLDYTVESYQYLSALNATTLENAPAVPITSALERYVQLPTNIPASVQALAERIIAGQTSEYGKALALQNFFISPSSGFTYSLNPPDDGYGISSLVNFLFSTKSGFCQQFAGAYAVLARAVGLPTRLAVGFSTGTKSGNSYQVTDADAHAWPEVYFGPTLGWLPFEPTKGFSDPVAHGYAPSSGASSATGPQSSAGTQSPRNPSGTATTVPNGAAPVTPTTVASGAASGGTSRNRHSNAPWLVVLALVFLLIAWVAFVVGGRRARWHIRRWRCRHDQAGLALAAWEEVTEVLNWLGAHRFPGETNEEFATRAAELVAFRLRESSGSQGGRIKRMARMATEASFAPTVRPQLGDDALAVAKELRRMLLRSAGSRQRLTWLLVPRPSAGATSRRDQIAGATGPGNGPPQEAWAGDRIGAGTA